eukprot:3844095-Pleurochrysis_carterae.AAC.5
MKEKAREGVCERGREPGRARAASSDDVGSRPRRRAARGLLLRSPPVGGSEAPRRHRLVLGRGLPSSRLVQRVRDGARRVLARVDLLVLLRDGCERV